MKRLAILLAGAMVLPAAAVTASRSFESLDQDPLTTFRSNTDAVSVDVSVRRGKRPVSGLKASDFEVFDNGVPQTILDIGYEKLPTDVTVLLDVSESVTGPMLNMLQRGVGQLREGLESRDRLKLVTFNMRIRRLADFAGPGDSARRRIRLGRGHRQQRNFRCARRGAHRAERRRAAAADCLVQ